MFTRTWIYLQTETLATEFLNPKNPIFYQSLPHKIETEKGTIVSETEMYGQ